MRFHIEGCLKDGDTVPEYLKNGDYWIQYDFDDNALPVVDKEVTEYFKKYCKNDPVLSKIKSLEREDLLRVINGTYIAERFFGRSASWFSQKLNRNLKNGKPCDFTPEERATLADALEVIGLELQNLSDGLRGE